MTNSVMTPGIITSFARHVRTSDGIRIVYDFYPSEGRAAVLVVPGFWRTRRHPTIIAIASFLAEIGYSVAVMDVRGHGDSGGVYGFNKMEHHDVAAVAADILNGDRPDQGSPQASQRLYAGKPPETITLIGLSMGGAIAVSTAVRHELPLSGLLLISPVAAFSLIAPKVNPLTIHRHIAMGQVFRRPRIDWRFPRSEKLRALDEIGRVNAPIGLIHLENDWLINHRHSQILFDRAKEPKELYLLDLPGNYHADSVFRLYGSPVRAILSDCLARWNPGA